MTERERYRETILFGKPDKVFFDPGTPRESTLKKWQEQGLPEKEHYMEYLFKILGIKEEYCSKRIDPAISYKMVPEFEEKVIEHKNGHYIVQDWMGAIVEISDEFDLSYLRFAKDFVTRKWHKFPVENRNDWENMKWRYNASTKERYPNDFDDMCEKLKNRNYVLGMYINGPFWQLRDWCGFENLCILMIEDPEFVQEMVVFWTKFVSDMMSFALSKIQFDYVFISEDMAYKEHSMISMDMTRKFLMPSYKQWVKEIKRSGCEVINMDSDGHVGELIPIWIKSDINCCFPIEVAAGNDIVEYRKIYGKNIAYTGGIDKRELAKGGKYLEKEILRVVPPLIKEGGFIAGCDHAIPPDISWNNFVEYSKLILKLTGWM